MTKHDDWMVRGEQFPPYDREKAPFAPWNEAAQWGDEKNRTTFADALEWHQAHPKSDGLVYIQTEDDPFLFVDGDDVRCPDSGGVHPVFISLLEHFGMTYADVSTSGTGVHAVYRGDLPVDETVATWQIDTEPWGANTDSPAIEIYSGKHVNITTGDHVNGTPETAQPWNAETAYDILEVNGCGGLTAREELQQAAAEADVGGADQHDGGGDHIRAMKRLDARRVAEDTIVKEWTSSSNNRLRSFLPTWGSSDDGGTANIVDADFWVDTGKNGGRGGVIEMALIDLGELRNTNAEIGCASGSDFWTGYEHLRDLGFDLPEPPYTGDSEPASGYYETDLGSHTGGDPWSDPDAMLEACLSAREAGAVPPEAEPPTLALIPIARDLLGVESPSEATKEEALDVYHEMSVDDHDGQRVVL